MPSESTPLPGQSTAPVAGTDVADRMLPESALDALGDPVSRSILRSAGSRPRTVEGLARDCDVSVSTIYRRLETLLAADLVERHVSPLPGTSPTYRTLPGRVTVDVGDDRVGGRATDPAGAVTTELALAAAVDAAATGDPDTAEPGEEVPLGAAVDRVLDAIDVEHVEYDADDGSLLVGFHADGRVVGCLLDVLEARGRDDAEADGYR